jgi:hypothetical protein
MPKNLSTFIKDVLEATCHIWGEVVPSCVPFRLWNTDKKVFLERRSEGRLGIFGRTAEIRPILLRRFAIFTQSVVVLGSVLLVWFLPVSTQGFAGKRPANV